MLFLVKQALLWPGAAILSHLRFCLKGLFWDDISFVILRRRSTLGRIWDILPTFYSQLSPPPISYILFLFGELLWHDCWYLCKRTITKYISLCLFWLRECWEQATKFSGQRLDKSVSKKLWDGKLFNYDLIITWL